MKDYSNFVNFAYLITFGIIIIFSSVTLWRFFKNSKKLANTKSGLQKDQNDKKNQK